MRIRSIKPQFFADDHLGALDPRARLLFIGLWCAADGHGRLEDRPRRLAAQILPYDDVDIDGLLDALQSAGKIVRYEGKDGSRVISVTGFGRNQRISGREKAEPSRWACPPLAHTVPIRPEDPADEPGSNREAIGKQSGSIREAVNVLEMETEMETETETETEGRRKGGGVGDGAHAVDPPAADAPAGAAVLLFPEPGDIEVPPRRQPGSRKEADDVHRVYTHWRRHHPQAPPRLFAKGKSKARQRILDRLREGLSVADLCRAIDGAHLSPFHCGANDRGEKYLGLQLILRDADQATKFIEICDAGGVAPVNPKSSANAATLNSWLRGSTDD